MTEAETAETAAEETEAEKDSQTEIKTEIEQETEGSEAEKSETNDVLEIGEESSETEPSSDDTEVEKRIVSIHIPYNENGRLTENLLEGFRYAVYQTEPAEGDISLKEYEASFDDLVAESQQTFDIEVPVNGVLYFEPVIKDIAELESVRYSYEGALTPEDGVYKVSNVQSDSDIVIHAIRYYRLVLQADHAKFYQSEEDQASGVELTECRISRKQSETILVVPEEGYVFSTIDSNSTGIMASKNKLDRNTCILAVNEKSKATIKEPVTIYATAEILKEYDVTFDWPANDLDVFVNDDEQLTQDNKTIKVTEGSSAYFTVKPKDNTKSVFVEYTDEKTGETIIPGFDYEEEEGSYYYYIGEEYGVLGNISVNISVADYHTITFNTKSKYVNTFEYRYKGGDVGFEAEFDPVDDTSDVPVERTYSIQAPDGYELRFYSYIDLEYGTLTASTEQGELNRKGHYDEEDPYFAIIPKADMTVTLDVKPAKFTVDADEGVEFSICRYDDVQEAYVDIELSDGNSIYYYSSMDDVRLKVKKEERKRYKVSGEFDDGEIWKGNLEDLSEAEDEYAYYEFSIGYCQKVFIESYETVTLTLDRSEEIKVRKLYTYEDEEGNQEWTYDVLEEGENQVTADKDRDCFIGVYQNDDVYRYKLNYTNIAGDISGSLVFHDKLKLSDKYGNQEEWTIYKFVPTDDMTVTIEATPLEKYTVTVVLGEGVTNLYASDTYFEYGDNGILEDVIENSTILIEDITLEDNAKILKVEYETDGGTKRLASADYAPHQDVKYRINITGNTTIYVNAAPSEEFTIKFDNTDGYDVKIWEAGNYGSFENDPSSLTNNQITLANNKEYLFDIMLEDGYLVESVVATDESGTETLIERKTSDDNNEANEGYRIGTGYGNTQDFTIKVNLKTAYTLNFDMESASDLEIYSWEDRERQINDQRIAIAAEDGYSFYIFGYDESMYKMSVKESDSFTLTKDYRTVDEEYRYAVYTVSAKKGVTQLSKTATIVIEPNNDIYEVTISEYPFPDQERFHRLL